MCEPLYEKMPEIVHQCAVLGIFLSEYLLWQTRICPAVSGGDNLFVKVIRSQNDKKVFDILEEKSRREVLSMKRYASVDTSLCVSCGACMKICPRGAISIPTGIYAQVNRDACVGCGLCAKTCPATVITMMQEEKA